MPKEEDHLEGGGEKEPKEEERSQDAPETTVSKRVRANTQSPRMGNTPQASPPRFFSMEELMETAKGVNNMALAHEIMVNQAFQVKPAELPEGSLERHVKEIMHKAFWDCLEAELKEEPQTYGHSIKLLSEIRETLLSFLLPGQGRLRSRIEEVLDLPLIQQQAENGALDIGKLSQFIVGMMGSLCAPCRDEDISKLKEITEIVPLLKAIFSVLDLMKVDMANFALTSIRPHLMQQSVEYERGKFQMFLEKHPNALDYTEKWLEDTVRCLREEGSSSSSASSDPPPLLPVNVHNHAYFRLLRWNHASDPFPETVLMDQVRFQEMHREEEQLVLLSSVLLIVYTTTGEAISGLPGLMEKLKSIVTVMLADLHAASFNIQEALATIGEKLCVELSQCLSQHGYSPLSADRKSTLKGQISAIVQPDNTVRKLMESRIQNYLLASLESSQHKTPPTLPGGLAPVSKEVKELAVRFSRLINFNKLVFSPFYTKILQKLLMTFVGGSTSCVFEFGSDRDLLSFPSLRVSDSKLPTGLPGVQSTQDPPTLPGGLAPVSKEVKDSRGEFLRRDISGLITIRPCCVQYY
ncbi:T-complex protein 11-like protein 1 [Anoplopoma fimbria]|uniref:T-complex protein 11-like protein 1 n=1 Tax=Anoplopoma fimbria TaxID=229290 RepID=UPI0023ED1B37|nr:T-complex protein 11-like protein 1 [Anoplopoma fimbria]